MGKLNEKCRYKVTLVGRKKRRGHISNLKNQGYERKNVSESTEEMQDALHMLDTPDSNVGFETSLANSTFTTENANTFMAENADTENGSRELPEEATESSIGSECSSKINNTNDSEGLVGNRIVDILYVLECLKRINLHGERFGCSINNLVFTLERRYGLRSELFFKCNMCNETFKLSTVDPNGTSMNLNTAAVAGCMSTGNGHSNMEELLSVMNIPPMSSSTYKEHHRIASAGWEAWNHYKKNWGKISYYNLRMSEEQADELFEALVKIFEETSDPVERAERFHSEWYEMFPERQNSVTLTTKETSTFHNQANNRGRFLKELGKQLSMPAILTRLKIPNLYRNLPMRLGIECALGKPLIAADSKENRGQRNSPPRDAQVG
ncbi:hypothetical protein ILUMI_21498 [Ignelater luminosus]|uniref:Mutator-like transposase domain-containing protein n=1 Tax=Ignelater luminosus TaxID=2038154 RepID=A0A8K0G3J3_IGNLU|nr:hypothetical protein ILUMI_21498 [Ignelater luminosus]